MHSCERSRIEETYYRDLYETLKLLGLSLTRHTHELDLIDRSLFTFNSVSLQVSFHKSQASASCDTPTSGNPSEKSNSTHELVGMIHITLIHESSHAFSRLMSYLFMRPVTLIHDQACHTFPWR